MIGYRQTPTASHGGLSQAVHRRPTGHPKHERQPFPAAMVTHVETHVLDSCPCCGGAVRPTGDKAQVVQQVDIRRPPQTIEQHTRPEFWCDHCTRGFMAALPTHIERGGLVGPQLTALIAFMKGACHASFSTVRIFLRDVLGVTISRGQLANILGTVRAALDKHSEELLALLPDEVALNVDETGHHENGQLWWIRFVVIDRHITQGTRGEAGRRFCERMWTTIATCVQQGRSV